MAFWQWGTASRGPQQHLLCVRTGAHLFLDANGNLLGSNSVNQHLSQAYRVEPTGDGYIIAGGTEDALQYGVIKINASGNVLWSRTFGGNNEDHCFGMDLGADGSIFLAGHTLSGTANWDTYTMKLSGSGTQLWQRTQAIPGLQPFYIHDENSGAFGPLPMEVASSRRVPATSIPIPNAAVVFAPTQWEAYIVKFGPDGDAVAGDVRKQLGNDWAAEDIDLTTDGGGIVAVDNSNLAS